MDLSRVVGQRVAEARRERGLTQAQLGQALESHLGQRWAKQTVSVAERGRREFSVRELLAIAACLDQPLGYFFAPPGAKDDLTEFSKGVAIPTKELLAIVYGLDSPEPWAPATQAMVMQFAAEIAATLGKLGETSLKELPERVAHALQVAKLIAHLSAGYPPTGPLITELSGPAVTSTAEEGGSDAEK